MKQIAISSLDSTMASVMVCHFLTMGNIHAKEIRQFLPWASSANSSNHNFIIFISLQISKTLQKHNHWDHQMQFWLLEVLWLVFSQYFLYWSWLLLSHHTILENESITFFLAPFLLPLIRSLFLLTSMVMLRVSITHNVSTAIEALSR